MAEPLQPVLALLHRLDERGHVLDRADLGEHPHCGLVGTAVQRAVQRGGGRRARGVRIGMGRADDAHRGRAAVLLVLRVEDEQKVERLHEHRIGVVLADPPHHVEEVGGEAQRVVGVDERESRAEPMAARGERRHLRDQAEDLLVAGLGVEDVLRVVVEGRQRGDGGDEHPHRVRVVVEPVHEPLAHVLVDERVVRDVARSTGRAGRRSGSSPFSSRYATSRYVDFSASCSIGYPR